MAPEGTIVRPATRDDLDGVRAIARAYGNLGSWPERPDYLDHELTSGRLLLADDDGEDPIAFAGVLEREGVAHLADLFVRRDRLGAGIGGALLAEVLAGTRGRVTFASSDPRALPLYVRHGMLPLAPLLYLKGDERALGRLPAPTGIPVEEVGPEDVAELDARSCGRRRPEDLAFLSEAGATALLCRRGDDPVGYGFSRPLGSGKGGGGTRAVLGPLGAVTEQGARDTVLAVAGAAAAGGATTVYVALPGPHPALVELLRAGFRVGDVDTLMTSSPELLDWRLYAPSSDLG